jgi:hypothetical protein
MKKLLLLLILSLFSIQGYAGSCPDGSDPVKSISADGTYFVYNCGNNTNNDVANKSEASIIGQSIYKTITKGDAEIYEAQMLLNRFSSYPVVSPNGQWTSATQSAIQKFYQELGQSFNGKWSSQILSDLKDRRLITMPRSGPLSFAEKGEILDEIQLKSDAVTKLEKVWYQLNQLKFDVVTADEVAPPFCYPTPDNCTDHIGIYTPDPANAVAGDFNGDGLQDLAISWMYLIHTTKREKTPSHVRFYLNDGKNNLISSPEIYALGEVPLRHFLYRMTVNDFNSDGRDDLFVGSMGVIMRVKGQTRSLVDFEPNLLLLSTQNGQMEDASHLIEGQENGGMIKDYEFSHTTTSGDINCDGFIDIYTGNVLLIGDGTGKFINKSRDLPEGMHGKTNAFASTIADFNGDGCGDVAIHLQDKTINVWMSNYGKHMSRTFKELKMENYYGKGNMKVNDMSSGDLDGDGDPDLVAAITRKSPYYKGRKILIFINEEGELIEKTKTLIQDERDQDVKGKLQNHGEGTIRLVDHDRDGDLDIIDSTSGSYRQNGRLGYTIFENDGTGHFTVIPDSELVILEEDMFHGYTYNLPQTSYGYPVDIDGVGRLDYVSFMRSPSDSTIASLYRYNTVYGYTVLGRDKPIDMEELKKVQEEKAKQLAEEKRILEEELKKVQEEKAKQLASETAIFNGRYSFNLFRYHDDEDWQELGNGFVEIRNGEVIIEKDNRYLKTGSTDLYDTFGGQINEKGKISASMELDILSGEVDRSEVYNLSGQIDKKIWGKSAREKHYKVYLLLETVDTEESIALRSPLFDGRYSFIVLRYRKDEGSISIGNGSLEIKDGNFLIEKKNRYLQSGPTDLYDTLSAQIDESGQVYGSITLDVLTGIDQSEVYEFNGPIDKKIGGKGPYEDEFEVYFELEPIDSSY